MIDIKYQDINSDEFERMMKENPNAVVLDIRSQMELSEGYIEGSTLMDMWSPDFMQKIQEMDRDKTYMLYCRSGNRSGHVCDLMAQMGFKNVYNLNGGILAWHYYHSHN
jgi:rhodanese-related sulfurtransferase